MVLNSFHRGAGFESLNFQDERTSLNPDPKVMVVTIPLSLSSLSPLSFSYHC